CSKPRRRSAARATALGAEVVVSSRVTGVERSNGGWSIDFAANGDGRRLQADAVVFAAGGFHNSKELVSRFITPWAAELVIRGNRESDGIALRALVPIGAEL